MLGKIKKVLGIEGVRVELICDDNYPRESQVVHGKLRFTTKSDGKVKSFKITLIEQYARGRKKSKLVDEYKLGVFDSLEAFSIAREEIVEIPFTLKYTRTLSEMDRIEEGNSVAAIFVGLAKKIKGVKSTFKLRVEADVAGTKLNPFAERIITFR